MCEKKSIKEEQYRMVATRRQGFDVMLWQTPVLSLTAQAFLFAIALGAGNKPAARIISAILALIAALASLQLMAKHRYNEVEDSHFLQEFEKEHECEGFMPIHRRKPSSSEAGPWYARLSSYKVWLITLSAFAVAAVLVLISVLFKLSWLDL